MGKCNHANCFIADGESCQMGEANFSECEHWQESESEVAGEGSYEVDGSRVPWSSAALGSADLIRLYQQSPSVLVGLLGAENSGKTTFLAANYLRLLVGDMYEGKHFCGSQSLGAWETIAAHLRIKNNDKFTFPPHTPRSSGRTPGILHFSLKDASGVVKNVFFTDSPGEWFSKWSINADSPDATGAKWIEENSDAFLIFADCEKLAGEQKSKARNELRGIIERLGETVGKRPVILVWAKSDISPKEGIKSAIQRALSRNIPQAIEMEISVSKSEEMINITSCVLNESWSPVRPNTMQEPVLQHNPFAAFRGYYEFT